jgi:hypothetical protein
MPRPLFTPGKDPLPILQEAGWSPGPVWIGAENLAPTGIRSLDHPANFTSFQKNYGFAIVEFWLDFLLIILFLKHLKFKST